MLAAMAIFFGGCMPFDLDLYRHLVKSGFTSIPEATQMEVLFPDIDHMIGSDISKNGTRKWISEAFIAGRYTLDMSVDIVVSANGSEVLRTASEPVFHLHEVEQVRALSDTDGPVETRFLRQWKISRSDWEKVVKADGDFGVIDIKIDPDHPIPGFELFRRAAGRDRVHVNNKTKR